jgi:hypothetical protein
VNLAFAWPVLLTNSRSLLLPKIEKEKALGHFSHGQ